MMNRLTMWAVLVILFMFTILVAVLMEYSYVAPAILTGVSLAMYFREDMKENKSLKGLAGVGISIRQDERNRIREDVRNIEGSCLSCGADGTCMDDNALSCAFKDVLKVLEER